MHISAIQTAPPQTLTIIAVLALAAAGAVIALFRMFGRKRRKRPGQDQRRANASHESRRKRDAGIRRKDNSRM